MLTSHFRFPLTPCVHRLFWAFCSSRKCTDPSSSQGKRASYENQQVTGNSTAFVGLAFYSPSDPSPTRPNRPLLPTDEMKDFSVKAIFEKNLLRPLNMFLTEPVVTVLTIYNSFTCEFLRSGQLLTLH